MQRVLKSLSHAGLTVALACATGVLSGSSAFSGAVALPKAVKLAPHRAIYDMKLGDIDDGAGISSLNGRMVYDFTGSQCEGYSVNFRFVTEFLSEDGGSQITDLQTTSFEGANAESYQFLSKTFVDQQLVEESRGTATLGPEARSVELKKPSEKTLEIGRQVLFPTEHLLAILKSAGEGVHFLAADIYDGAETGEKVYATTSVIGAAAVSPAAGDPKAPEASLAGKTYWPVTVAYFDPGEEDAAGEHLPVYQLSFWLYGNGISSHLKLDYGDFTIHGTMASLELFDEADCPQQQR